MFETMIHADWSTSPKKRWAARARRADGNWLIEDPELVGSCEALLDHVFAAAADGPVLIGFDFPIGLPAAFAARAGITSFREALPLLGEGRWKDFFQVAETPGEISLERPFYPRSSAKGATRAALLAGLGVSRYEELLRTCERRTSDRREACSLFWTLGGNQVGRAAMSGWREIVAPALLRGARIWPFDGSLPDLAKTSAVVIAETYPAEAYRMIDAGFAATESKRRVEDRRRRAQRILDWAVRHGVELSAGAHASILDGFGSKSNGEDKFDALFGLIKMIEVVDARRAETTERHQKAVAVEGWILGR